MQKGKRIIHPTTALELPDIDPEVCREMYLNGELKQLLIPVLPEAVDMSQIILMSLTSEKTHSPLDNLFVSKSRHDAGKLILTTNCDSFNILKQNNQQRKVKVRCSYCECKVDYQLIPMPVSLNALVGMLPSKKPDRQLRPSSDGVVYEIGGTKGYCLTRCMLKKARKKLKIPKSDTKYDWVTIVQNIERLHRIIYGDDGPVLRPALSKGLLICNQGTKTREEWLNDDGIEYRKSPSLIYWPAKEVYKVV